MANEQVRGGGFRGVGGLQFWVGQSFTIASTIVGVYLAGYVGFQRTLEYDAFLKARQQVNMLAGLETEMTENVALLTPLLERMETANTQGIAVQAPHWPVMRYYLWDAAAENEALFAVSPTLIAQMQAFYVETQALLEDERLREHFRRLSGTNAFERNQAYATLEGLVVRFNSDIQGAIDEAQAEPAAVVERYRR